MDEPTNILIVDDLPEKLLVFATVLEELNQNLVLVRSGSDALREVLAREFAVILLDVNMPDIDGFESAALIRQYRRSAHTPIIFITAYADEMQTARGYSLGAVDYILSPVVPEVLRSKVQVFVDLHNMQRRVRAQADERVALLAAEAARRTAEDNTRRSNFLLRASRELSTSLDLDVGIRRLLELLVPGLANNALLVLNEMQSEQDVVMAAELLEHDGANYAKLPFDQLAPEVRQVLNDVRSGHGRVQFEATELFAGKPGPCHVAVMPLLIGAQILGALLVAAKHDEHDWAALDELVSRAAIAFENARLYRSLQTEILERREAEKKLQDSNRRKDEFLAMLSHELRNPLAPIRNAVELVRIFAPPDTKLAWAADVTERQVNHLTKLVEELLDVARISQGKIVLQMRPVDLLAVISQGVETVRPYIDARRHTLTLNLPEGPLWLLGDHARLAQVVANLLNNAAKYTKEGGHITVTVETSEEQIILSVIDNGIGIEAELLPNVFELFEQGKQTLDRSQGGLGVGLTLVQRLVQLHGGRVDVFSDGPGRGAEFRVYLPCQCESQLSENILSDLTERKQTHTCRILVVDDNADAATTVGLLLEMAGHEVQTVDEGTKALDCVRTFLPEVVVLDIGLPEIDGYEIARQIRRLPRAANTLLIALTGYGQKSDQDQALDAGFDLHLAKPADPNVLNRLISDWLSRRSKSGKPG